MLLRDDFSCKDSIFLTVFQLATPLKEEITTKPLALLRPNLSEKMTQMTQIVSPRSSRENNDRFADFLQKLAF